MVLTGLENDYYLAGNDIWLKISSFTNPVQKMEIIFKNLTTNNILEKLILYPSPANDFYFNVCQPIRALFPEVDFNSNNSLQKFKIDFTVTFINPGIPQMIQSFERHFVRAWRKKSNDSKWHFENYEELALKPWPMWIGVDLPGYAQRILNSTVVNYLPIEKKMLRPKSCDFKIIKFLNSLGGWQFYIFDSWEIKQKAKPNKFSKIIQTSLNSNSFKNLGLETEENIELVASTPFELQHIIEDLLFSQEVYMLDDDNTNWIKLRLDSNQVIKNNKDNVFENKLSYSIINNINIWA